MKYKKAGESIDLFESIKQKRAIQKWYHRVVMTMRFRIKWEQFKQRHVFRMK
jgi:hypothetical protein